MSILDKGMLLQSFKEYMAVKLIVSLDFFFVFIIILIILMRLMNKVLKLKQFEWMIYVIIFGFIVKIMILYWSLNGWFCMAYKITFFNDQFLYTPGVFYLHIFICIIAICLFIALLDYFY